MSLGAGRPARADSPADSRQTLSRFADGSDVTDQRIALIELIKAKHLRAVAESDQLQLGFERLAELIRNGRSEQERLLAVATLRRAASVRSLQQKIGELLRESLTQPLRDLHELSDADDRLYAARSWRDAPSGWPSSVLASAAVREESAERVRTECLEGLVDRAPDEVDASSEAESGAGSANTNNFTDIVRILRFALEKIEFKTKKPGDSMGRRLIRILDALTSTLAMADKRVGENAGREFQLLIVRAFRATGKPESAGVRDEVAKQVAGLTHAIIRMDFSQGMKDSNYGALRIVSKWFRTREWQDVCESSQAIRSLRKDVRTSLVIQMEAGRSDDGLRDALFLVVGSTRKATAICKAIATERPGIPDDMRDWLIRAPKRIRVDAASESRRRAIDEVLAELLLVRRRLAPVAELVEADVLPDIRIVLPQQVRLVSRLSGLAQEMASKLGLAAEWRSLRVRGETGQEVDFSPIEHERDPGDPHTRRVRLLGPLVEQISEDGVPRTVLKARVEPVVAPHEAHGPYAAAEPAVRLRRSVPTT